TKQEVPLKKLSAEQMIVWEARDLELVEAWAFRDTEKLPENSMSHLARLYKADNYSEIQF
ncbi:hypothetical protein AVEN_212558-1, partial [Araneus ventricosus]